MSLSPFINGHAYLHIKASNKSNTKKKKKMPDSV